MLTITLQIGNSDDRLSQREWHDYVEAVRAVLEVNHVQVHFFGAPPNWTPWQNAAWVFVIEREQIPDLQAALIEIRVEFRQDSFAWSEGETAFL